MICAEYKTVDFIPSDISEQLIQTGYRDGVMKSRARYSSIARIYEVKILVDGINFKTIMDKAHSLVSQNGTWTEDFRNPLNANTVETFKVILAGTETVMKRDRDGKSWHYVSFSLRNI